MSHHHDIFYDSGQPYSFAYYDYKSKLYFLRNAKMIIFCFLVKIITTHTHTHTWIYKKQTKSKLFYSVNLVGFSLHISSHISRREPQIYPAAHVSLHTLTHTHIHTHIHTHTHTRSFIRPHTIIRKYNLHKHTHRHIHAHIKSCTQF